MDLNDFERQTRDFVTSFRRRTGYRKLTSRRSIPYGRVNVGRGFVGDYVGRGNNVFGSNIDKMAPNIGNDSEEFGNNGECGGVDVEIIGWKMVITHLTMETSNNSSKRENSSDDECDHDFDYLSQTDNNSSNDEFDNECDYELIEKVCDKLSCHVLDERNKYRNGVKVEHIVLCDHHLYHQNINQLNDAILTEPILHDNNNINNINNDNNNNNTDTHINADTDSDSDSDNDNTASNNIAINDVLFDSIPNSFEDFLLTVYNLNPLFLTCNQSKVSFKDRPDYKKQYENYDSYRNVFIPRIFDELWCSMKTSRLSRTDCDYKSTRFRLIDFDERLKKLKRIELHMIRDSTDCQFSFGQIIILKYISDDNSDSEQKSVFGVITSIHSQLSDDISVTDQIIDQQEHNNTRIVDRMCVVCNKVNLNSDRVSILGLNCVQSYLLQARLIYEFQQFSIWNQVLNPIHSAEITGLQIHVDRETAIKYFDDQFEAIQKGYDCSVLENASISQFVAIYGTKKTGKTEVLRETALQILKYGPIHNQIKGPEKLIIVSNNKDEILATFKHLKKHSISVLHIDNKGIGSSHKKSDITKAIKHLGLSADTIKLISDQQVYHECIEYYSNSNKTEAIKELSVKAKLLSEQLLSLVLAKLINDSQVIIGELDCIFNDLMFNTAYRGTDFNKVKKIALIDDAERYSEPEIFMLLFAGIEKIILYGDIIDKNVYLKSFLKRYVTLFNSTKKGKIANSHNSVFHLKTTIEDQINKLKNINIQKCVQQSQNNVSRPKYFSGFKYKDHKTQNGRYINNWKNNSVYKNTWNNRVKKLKTTHFNTSHTNINNNNGKRYFEDTNPMGCDDSAMIGDNKSFTNNLAYGSRHSYSGANCDQFSSDTISSSTSSYY